jgi:hypothetical protein
MKSMVDQVIAADKVPVIALIQWGRATNLHANVTAYNNVIKQLWAEYPVIVQGPDFETFFRNNQNLISADGIHPTSPEGFGAYRKLWIEDMLAKVYSGSVQHLRATTGLTQEQICTARLDEETQCPIPQHVQPGERKRIRQH